MPFLQWNLMKTFWNTVSSSSFYATDQSQQFIRSLMFCHNWKTVSIYEWHMNGMCCFESDFLKAWNAYPHIHFIPQNHQFSFYFLNWLYSYPFCCSHAIFQHNCKFVQKERRGEEKKILKIINTAKLFILYPFLSWTPHWHHNNFDVDFENCTQLFGCEMKQTQKKEKQRKAVDLKWPTVIEVRKCELWNATKCVTHLHFNSICLKIFIPATITT